MGITLSEAWKIADNIGKYLGLNNRQRRVRFERGNGALIRARYTQKHHGTWAHLVYRETHYEFHFGHGVIIIVGLDGEPEFFHRRKSLS